MLPTLAKKGHLKAPSSPKANPAEVEGLQKQLNEWVPIQYVIEWFRRRANNVGIENRVLVLKVETAGGKSTMFPPELYNAMVRGTDLPGIICTQPRVVTAIANVHEILKNYPNLRLGETIGWSTQYNKLRPTGFGLLSATIGTLTAQLQSMTDEEFMNAYRFVLIDETHERDLQTDMAISVLKGILTRNSKNPRCPFVVLMSATFEPAKFLRYFGLPAAPPLQLFAGNFVWCVGQSAGFTEEWDWNDGKTVPNYPAAAAAVVRKIIAENPDDPVEKGDIIIFMPGAKEATSTLEALNVLNHELFRKGENIFSPLNIERSVIVSQGPDYRGLSLPLEQHRVVIRTKSGEAKPKSAPTRRVIIGTNVLETGITLPGLKYVIDSGYNREIEYNPIYRVRALITRPAPESRVIQRRGRAGRKFPGVFYPLYPVGVFRKLPNQQFAQILTEDCTDIFLDIIFEQLRSKTALAAKDGKILSEEPEFRISDIDMLDNPPADSISAAIEALYSVGYIKCAGGGGETETNSTATKAEATGRPEGAEMGVLPAADKATNSRSIPLPGSQGIVVTPLGRLAGRLSGVRPEITRIILAAFSWKANPLDMLTIAAYLLVDTQLLKTDMVDGKQMQDLQTNWGEIYHRALGGQPHASSATKVRLLLADEFIDGLALFLAARVIITANQQDAVKELRQWCHKNSVSHGGLMQFLKTRDDLIERCLAAGINVFAPYTSLGDPSVPYVETCARIKSCIYEGFRRNAATLRDGAYCSVAGMPIKMPALLRELTKQFGDGVLPRNILYHELLLRQDTQTNVYTARTNRVSVMDGFVCVDGDFIGPGYAWREQP